MSERREPAMIFVEDLRLEARVGVYPKEQTVTQTVALDIEVGTAVDDMARAAGSERLRDTINYERIASRAERVVEERHFPLVETLADRIADAVAGLRGATWARVRLRKLGCLEGAHAAGVQVFRAADAPPAADAPQTVTPIARDAVLTTEEVVVIGGGAAGLTAALWCWRLGHPALIVDPAQHLGGQLHVVNLPMIDLPATPAIAGPDLAERFARQLAGHDGRWLRAAVRAIDADANGCRLTLETPEDTINARTVIVATGLRRRTLDVPGEAELRGRGVLATATRDIETLRGQRVVVIGGGDAACDNALLLDGAGAEVTLVHRRATLSARDEFRAALGDHPRIARRFERSATRLVGEDRLEAVVVDGPKGEETIAADAVLVRIGWIPQGVTLPAAWKDDRGFLRVDAAGLVVGQERVFGAGDIIGPTVPCVAASVGSAACAARAAVSRLERD